MLLATVFFGGPAVSLGGAGYIERLPSLMMPIIVYSMVKFASHLKLRRLKQSTTKLLVVLPLIVIVFAGSTFYLSGRNFQSLTYGEYYSNDYLINYSSYSLMTGYSNLKVDTISDIMAAQIANESIGGMDLISIRRHSIIETYYYTLSDMETINNSIDGLYGNMSLVYSNPDVLIFRQID